MSSIPRNQAERIALDFDPSQDYCIQATPCADGPDSCQYEDACSDAWTEALRAEHSDPSAGIDTEGPF